MGHRAVAITIQAATPDVDVRVMPQYKPGETDAVIGPKYECPCWDTWHEHFNGTRDIYFPKGWCPAELTPALRGWLDAAGAAWYEFAHSEWEAQCAMGTRAAQPMPTSSVPLSTVTLGPPTRRRTKSQSARDIRWQLRRAQEVATWSKREPCELRTRTLCGVLNAIRRREPHDRANLPIGRLDRLLAETWDHLLGPQAAAATGVAKDPAATGAGITGWIEPKLRRLRLW